ncbi:MAG TPA: hypothetical protein PKD19_01720 [Candidatus Saccharibacteria bacterium]|jgi:hypothetical protein|nr:hypothetical protein [Candidatus Saccharibacteria bacterium]HMR38334.1 hypothetical protein [Candidatus Saccharibacteria bacterium]
MATTKKASTTKTTAKKPAKVPAKQAPVKKSATKTTRKKEAKMESFHAYKQDVSFLTTRVTIQTAYWAILSIFVLALGLWVISINDQISRIQDQIDQSIIEQRELDAKELQLLREQVKNKQR